MALSTTLGTTESKMEAKALNQFYTDPEDASIAVAVVDSLYGLDSFNWILEPSAGAGAFLQALNKRSLICDLAKEGIDAIDLDPKHPSVSQLDFFDYQFREGRGLVIGNPPYGRRAKLALQFIERSARYADVIAFVLPRSFVRAALQNRVPQNFHLVHQHLLDSFHLPDGKQVMIRSVFQVWERRGCERVLMPTPKSHEDFKLTQRHLSRTSADDLLQVREEYPLCIGQNNLRWAASLDGPKRGSVWFVKPKNQEVADKLRGLDFDDIKYDSTCAPSLSKSDIINKYMQNEEQKKT